MEHGNQRFKARPPQSGSSAAAGLGFQFAASLVLFFFAGQWLDRRLGTAPVFLLVGVFVGGGGSFYSMYRRLMNAQRREDEAKAAERASERERKP
jgi:ATP synthase protein I